LIPTNQSSHFAELKPTDNEINLNSFREKIDDSTYVCGDRFDVLRKFPCNERLHCSDDIEMVYYSGLADMAIEDAICYACGVKLSLEFFSKYIEKDIYSQVFPTPAFPTCGMERCKKFNAKLFKQKRARKVDSKAKEENRLRKRQRTLQPRQEAAHNADGMDLDIDG